MMIDLNTFGPPERRGRIDLFTAIKNFQDAIATAGFGRPDIEADGQIQRFDLPEDRAGSKNGWYVFFADDNPCPAGCFGSWKHGQMGTWSAKAKYELSAAEVAEQDRRIAEVKAARKAAQEQAGLKAAERLWSMYTRLPDATPDNTPYLERKQVGSFGGVKSLRGTLCVPLLDREGRFAGLQFIPAKEGEKKKFGKDVSPTDRFNVLQGDNATVYICEGYATGASIHMATGHTVVLAFTANNLLAVGKQIRDLPAFQGSSFILAADDDRWARRPDGQLWNAGLENARAASAALGIPIVSPVFRDLSSRPTDFNDLHVLEGLDAVALQATARNIGVKLHEWDSMSAYAGDPTAREWIVRGVFPRGQASLVAASGGIGKSFLLLSLAREIASQNLVRQPQFGGSLEATGGVVYISAEDDQIEIHNRLASLGGPVTGLYAVPLPNAGGAKPYFQAEDKHFLPSEFWKSLTAQLRLLPNLTTLILDPIQPLCAMDLNMPEAAQSVCSFLADLAAELHIAVIVAHHFRKSTVSSPEEARNAIRGTAGLVDGVRSVYAMWQAQDGDTKKICKKLGMAYKHDAVILGCVVKGNSEKLPGVRTFVRQENGVLVDKSHEVKGIVDEQLLLVALADVIGEAAEAGKPYTKTSSNGLYERRNELPEPLCLISKHKIQEMAEALIESGKIKVCAAKGSKAVKWLDVVGGPFADGVGVFTQGFFDSSEKSID